MKRTYEVRTTKRIDQLVRMSCLVLHVVEGKKPTRAAMAERLIDLGAEAFFKTHNWEIPDDLRPERTGEADKAQR